MTLKQAQKAAEYRYPYIETGGKGGEIYNDRVDLRREGYAQALTDHPQLSRSVLEAVRERCFQTWLNNSGKSIREVNLDDLLPVGDGWVDIGEYPENKPVVQRWHKIYKCIVSVYLKPGVSTVKGCDWVTGTLDRTWPELAFEPFFKPLPKAPNSKR